MQASKSAATDRASSTVKLTPAKKNEEQNPSIGGLQVDAQVAPGSSRVREADEDLSLLIINSAISNATTMAGATMPQYAQSLYAGAIPPLPAPPIAPEALIQDLDSFQISMQQVTQASLSMTSMNLGTNPRG